MKRRMPFLLIFCMVLLLPAVSVAARAADTSGACGDDLTWTFDEATGTLTIEGTGPMWDWDNLHSAPWYSHRSSIKSLVIQNGVSSIGDLAFSYCTSLTEVAIGNGVTSIGEKAFIYCWISQVTIPDSVTYIGVDAFFGCGRLTEVVIPDSVTCIDVWAFYYCINLTDITVDSNNPQYCSVDGVLFDKSKMTLIQYPAGKDAETYIIPDCVTSIGNQAFSHCDSLTEVSIPDCVTSIGIWAFYYCDGLTELTIPDSVTSIGTYAFYNCANLNQVTLGNGVTYIDDGAFYGSTSLTDVYFKGTEEQWNDINIGSYNDSLLNATIHYAFDPKTGAVSVPWLPEGAESALIAAYADGKLVCAVTGQVGNENYVPLAEQPDEIRIFYLYDNYQPVTGPDIIRLD